MNAAFTKWDATDETLYTYQSVDALCKARCLERGAFTIDQMSACLSVCIGDIHTAMHTECQQQCTDDCARNGGETWDIDNCTADCYDHC